MNARKKLEEGGDDLDEKENIEEEKDSLDFVNIKMKELGDGEELDIDAEPQLGIDFAKELKDGENEMNKIHDYSTMLGSKKTDDFYNAEPYKAPSSGEE